MIFQKDSDITDVHSFAAYLPFFGGMRETITIWGSCLNKFIQIFWSPHHLGYGFLFFAKITGQGEILDLIYKVILILEVLFSVCRDTVFCLI